MTRTEAVMTYVCLLSLSASFYVLTICRVLIFSYQLCIPYTVLCSGSGVLQGAARGASSVVWLDDDWSRTDVRESGGGMDRID